MIRAFYRPSLLYGFVTLKDADGQGNPLPETEYIFKSDDGAEIHAFDVCVFDFIHNGNA